MADDPYDLERFLSAQDPVHETALAELGAGRKRSHFMWFVFPQHVGLGRSGTARHYGIRSAAEASAYLDHPVLGRRLVDAVEAALQSDETDPRRLFGSPDGLKFRSCLTLFLAVAPDQETLRRALDRFYGGRPDEATLALLAQPSPQPHAGGG